MEGLAELLGVTVAQLTQLATLAVVLFVGLILLRVFMKLTATLFRVGCFGIILIVAAVYVLRLLPG
ncbi:MAG: hypothetical protein R3E31_06400 [Chloroflexota bacterium]|nr:hypothetical protein [Anaerolineales bacterium]MCA9978281.1 hypothetical protein [Anaerolineales bacterium]MCB8965308.1 hypothetical protein [Ardenticatenaceae bacterium]